VTGCTVSGSSGNRDLDETTCRIARSRVRFTPAKDDAGNPIASSYTLPVRWQLEE
jgi:protein TonB